MLYPLRLACLPEGDTVDVMVFLKMQGHGHPAPMPLSHATHAWDDGLKTGFMMTPSHEEKVGIAPKTGASPLSQGQV